MLDQEATIRVYTDAPAQVHFLPSRLYLTEPRCNSFANWTASQAQLPAIAQPLSIRWVYNGERAFECGSRRSVINDGSYMIFNAGSQFSSSIDSESVVQCYTICFQ